MSQSTAQQQNKLKAYVVEPLEEDWSMVAYTELYEDGRWVTGMTVVTSLQDVFQMAEKEEVPVYPANIMMKETQ